MFRTFTFGQISAQQIEPFDFTTVLVEMKLHVGMMVPSAQRA